LLGIASLAMAVSAWCWHLALGDAKPQSLIGSAVISAVLVQPVEARTAVPADGLNHTDVDENTRGENTADHAAEIDFAAQSSGPIEPAVAAASRESTIAVADRTPTGAPLAVSGPRAPPLRVG
jgi:hypothetical protein